MVFIQLIDKKEQFAVGAHITVSEQDPLHDGILETLRSTEKGIILKGSIVGLSDVKDGEAIYTVRNDLEGKLTMIRVPVRRTNIDLEGGWIWMAKPLWGAKGPLLRFPALVSTRSLLGPGAQRSDSSPSGFTQRDF